MTVSAITSFSGNSRFLSNFFPAKVVMDGHEYPSIEHAYQAAKTENPLEREAIRSAKTAGEAKRMGRLVTLRPNWEAMKEQIMEGLIRQKFADKVLRQELLETGDALLVEGNTWGDVYWGAVRRKGSDRFVGRNRLGVLLMEERKRCRLALEAAAWDARKGEPNLWENLEKEGWKDVAP